MIYDKNLYTGSLPLFLIIFFSLVFISWAHFSEITQHVRGQGRIIPSGKTKTIQHLEGGIISQINVEEGDLVQKGDVLFVIENIGMGTERNEVFLERLQLETRLIRLKAENNDYTQPKFPEKITKNYADIAEAEKQLFEARKSEFLNKIKGLNDKVNQKDLLLDSLETTRKNINAELEIAVKQRDLNKKLYEAGSISKSKYLDAQSKVVNFQTRLSSIKKEIPVVKSEKDEIKSNLEETLRENEAHIVEEINEVSFKIKQLEQRLDNYEDKILRKQVVAPVTGVLNSRKINTIGGVVKPGENIAEILPVEDLLIVEGQIASQDRPKIYLNMPVKIRLSAYDFKRTNAINGTLNHISADSFTDQAGKAFYKIRVVINHDSLSDEIEIFPGMAVDINIISDRISVLGSGSIKLI